jgi:hypothetical protein
MRHRCTRRLQWLAKLEGAREDAAAAIKQLQRMEAELERRLGTAEQDLAALAVEQSKAKKTLDWLSTSEIEAVKRSVRPPPARTHPSELPLGTRRLTAAHSLKSR